VMLLRHRQTKGPDSARLHLNRRATPRLHPNRCLTYCQPYGLPDACQEYDGRPYYSNKYGELSQDAVIIQLQRTTLGVAAYAFASCLIGTGKLDEATALLQQIDASALAQLTGNPDCDADIKLAQGEIAYRRGDYEAARGYVKAVTPVFTRKDAEQYQTHALAVLTAALDNLAPAIGFWRVAERM
jgi:hypothetical protein